MDYEQLYRAVQDYTENYESTFLENIPVFVKEAEKRIYNSVQIPALKKNATLTASSQYVNLPDDWLSNHYVAAILPSGAYEFLLNKDTSFLRSSYPNPSTTGVTRYYTIFGPQTGDVNELRMMLAPTPNATYSMDIQYFYYPPTIVQGEITTLGTVSGGGGYTNGFYQNVLLSGGSGAYARADITVAGNAVTQVVLRSGGNFYRVGDSLTASASTIGSAGAGFSVPVTALSNAEGTSWLGDNYDPVLLYGALREAILFMKGEQDMVTYYEAKYQEAIAQLTRLGGILENTDTYRGNA